MIRFIFIMIVTVFTACYVPAQSFMIPVEQQVPILIKVLLFNKHVPAEHSEYRIGVIYQQSVMESNTTKNIIMTTTDSTILKLSRGVPIRFIPINVEQGNECQQQLLENRISAVMVTPIDRSLRKNIAAYCCEHHIISMSTIPEYVDDDIAYGVTDVNGKRTILINLPVSISQGADFSSQVLRIAKVLR